ncbi:hypothetical protein B0H17DRAFT_1339287 [Mycena rosella]|uniref:Uncharacterized protein n=1 Tax=Mycena rosella TaxID=1033263 RepID=A0AAD7FSB6_MYCRO|nr:hypothetical protein B0H17DRAFT_1339287 [Mycena rosella]
MRFALDRQPLLDLHPLTSLLGEFRRFHRQSTRVYWHVISKDSTLAGGNIPDSQIASQIQTLNNDYAGNFNNAGPGTSQQTAMKASRQGGKGDLNVYTVGRWSSRILHVPVLRGYRAQWQIHECTHPRELQPPIFMMTSGATSAARSSNEPPMR